MAETVHIPIPKDDWIELSALAATLNGRVSNSGNAVLVYVQAIAKPDADSNSGHRLIDEDLFDYVVCPPEAVWMRALNFEGIASVTPDLAVRSTGGELSVIGGRGGVTSDALGTQKVSLDYSLFHGLFTFDVSPLVWNVEEDGVEVLSLTSTRATSIDGYLNLTSGATPGNTTQVESRRHFRYQPVRGLKWGSSVGFKGANLDGILRAGVFTDFENGAYFKTKGDGELYAVILNDGVETHEELIVFPFDIDITLGNIYDVQFQWRGVGVVTWFAGNPSTGLVEKVHEIIFLNTLDQGLFMQNPALSAGFYAENITEEVSLWSGCVDISAEGGDLEREQYGEFTTERTGVALNAPILVIRNPSLAPNGKINTRDLRLVRITAYASKKCTIKGYQTRNPATITGGTYVDVKTGSFVQANETSTAVNVDLMEVFTTITVPANFPFEKTNPFADSIDFFGVHGDYLVFVLTTGNTVDIDLTMEWGDSV